MKRKKSSDIEEVEVKKKKYQIEIVVLEFDHSKYNIVEENYPFTSRNIRLFWGDLGTIIGEFEKKYGLIDGTIYWDISKHLVGVVSSQNYFPPREENIFEKNLS